MEMKSVSSQKVENCLSVLRKMLEEAKNNKQNAIGYDAYEYFHHREKVLEKLTEELSSLES